MKPKDNVINEDPQELQDPQWLLGRKLTLFDFLVMAYDSVNDGDKISKKKKKKKKDLGRLRFHAKS